MADTVYRVMPSKRKSGFYGVFEITLYDDAPARVGEEIATEAVSLRAHEIAEKKNAEHS